MHYPTNDGISPAVESAIREYWSNVHERRRGEGLTFSLATDRLARHDAESLLTVLSQRRSGIGGSPLGYRSWWLTLDRSARHMNTQLDAGVWRTIRHSPVLSIDYLIKYLAFGPSRDRTSLSGRNIRTIFAEPVLESLPQDVLSVAQGVRSECGNLPENLIQRRIRDALDRERMRHGAVERAGLEGAMEAIKEAFE